MVGKVALMHLTCLTDGITNGSCDNCRGSSSSDKESSGRFILHVVAGRTGKGLVAGEPAWVSCL